MPTNINAHSDSDAVTSLADNEQIEWKVVYLGSDGSENKAIIEALTADDQYVKVVLTADCATWGQHLTFAGGEYVIFDLNGYTYTLDACHIDIKSRCFEIVDSSVAGTGVLNKVDEKDGFVIGANEGCETIIISGGAIVDAGVYCPSYEIGTRFIIRGGTMTGRAQGYQLPVVLIDNHIAYDLVTLAPYMVATRNSSGEIVSIATGANYDQAAYAISKSDTYSGAYNYVYGVAWDLAAGDCLLEHITANRPYYLWLRNSNREAYQLLTAL